MRVLVDTSVWSLAFRRKSVDNQVVGNLTDLIKDSRVVTIGLIRQEILSGIKSLEDFKTLRSEMRAFPDVQHVVEDYELGAEYFNLCRSNGVQGSIADCLISATAVNNGFKIYTADKDFYNFVEHIPIQLFEPKPI